MDNKYVLIIGNNKEYHSVHIFNKLKELGEKVVMFDVKMFPRFIDISYSPTGDIESSIIIQGKKIHIKSVFGRNYTPPVIDHNEEYYLNNKNLVSSIKGYLDNLDCIMVNKPDAYYLHWIKPKQLKLFNLELTKKGISNIKVPKTIITNNFFEIENFINKDEEYIYKPTQGGYSTRKFEINKTLELKTLLVSGPITFQEYIPGDDIRVYIIGKKLYSIKIKSVTSNSVDFRDDDNHQITVIDIPVELKRTCRRLAKISDYIFTAIDIKQDKKGTYYILEANPSPMFVGVEKKTKLPITNDLVKLLTLK